MKKINFLLSKSRLRLRIFIAILMSIILSESNLQAQTPVSAIYVSSNRNAPAEVEIGKSCNLYYSIDPWNATDRSVIYSFSPANAGTINGTNNGAYFTANNLGPVTITATSVSNPDIFGTTIINVVQSISVNAVYFTTAGINYLSYGQTIYLSHNVSPYYASDTNVTYEISDPLLGTIVQYSASGAARFIANSLTGIVTITARSVSNPSIILEKSLSIDSRIPVVTFDFYINTSSLYNDTSLIYPYVYPSYASDPSISWTVLPAQLGYISSNKFFSNSITGIVTITGVSVSDPSISATKIMAIDSIYGVINFQLSGNSTMAKNSNQQIFYYINPYYATNQSLNFTITPSYMGNMVSSTFFSNNIDGIVTITATSVSNPSVSKMLVVTVGSGVTATPTVTINTFVNQIRPNENLYISNSANTSLSILPIGSGTITNNNFTSSILGVVTITATSIIDNSISASKIIEVVSSIPTVSITSTLYVTTVMGYKSSISLPFVFTPLNADVTFEISDSDLGNLATLANYPYTYRRLDSKTVSGVVTVTATAVSNPSISAMVVVTISSSIAVGSTVGVNSVSINPYTSVMGISSSQTFTTNILPSNATNKNVTWSVTPSLYGNISGNGIFTSSLLSGVVTVTATSVSNPSILGKAVITITSGMPLNTFVGVTNVYVYSNNTVVGVGNSQFYNSSVVPSNATDATMIWTISPISMGSISPNGIFTAGTIAGIVTITATSASNTTVKGLAFVNIVNAPANIGVISVSLSQANSTILIGDTFQLTAAVSPFNATNQSLVWSLIPLDLGTINAQGVFTSNGIPGIVTVTAISSDNPSAKASSVITILEVVVFGPSALDSLINSTKSIVLNSGNVIIQWSTIAGISTYCIKYSTDSSFANNVITVCGLTNPYYTITGFNQPGNRLTADGQTIYYQIAAVDGAGQKHWTPTKTSNISKTTAINQSVENRELSLYPNPVNETLHVNGLIENDEVLIYDIVGSLLFKSTSSIIDVSALSSGVYVAKINFKSYRFVKQ